VIDGQPGIVIDAGPQVQMALVFHVSGARISAYDVIAHSQRLARLQIT
jgi:hypothetical protein